MRFPLFRTFELICIPSVQEIPTADSQRAALRVGRMSFGRNVIFDRQGTGRHTTRHRKTNVPETIGNDKQTFG